MLDTRRYERQMPVLNGCFTARLLIKDSDRTIYKAFASACELPTAVIPVLPSSPKALIM